MKIQLTYFGMLNEITKVENETFELSENTFEELKNVLLNKYPNLKNQTFRFAQNNELIEEGEVTETEISIFPPFSGG